MDALAQKVNHFKFPTGIKSEDYAPRKIILKLFDADDLPEQTNGKPAFSPDKIPAEIRALTILPFNSILGPPGRGKMRTSKRLDQMYIITLAEDSNLQDEINKLLQYSNVKYAEPMYTQTTLSEVIPNDNFPNDPGTDKQTYLKTIRAFEAWNIEQGDPAVTIAILDTGTDFDHPDLKDNLALNLNDPPNGQDDDLDSLIDNFSGWDFADNDNDPSVAGNTHGVWVTGLSSATANNNIGVAGTGFNCTYVPYKIFPDNKNISLNSYKALLYAAQHHDVLNLSWGSANSYSQAIQDCINEAVLEFDAVLVAAAGNEDKEVDYYPASYENVLSVTSIENNGAKSRNASYSYNVDLSAPGSANYTTIDGGRYGEAGIGTSFATPLVSGAAALVRARFPEYTAQQVMEQLRVTANEDIYEVPENEEFVGQIGKGRLDMYNALTSINKSVRLLDFKYSDPFGRFAFYSDTIKITGKFQNFLSPTTERATAILSTTSPYATLLTTDFKLGALQPLEQISFNAQPVTIILDENTPADEKILIKVDFKDSFYEDMQFIQFNTSPDYLNFGTNMISLTVAGNGDLGYTGEKLENGIGFNLKGEKIASHLGLIVYADGEIIDNVINDYDTQTTEADFHTTKNIRYFNNSTASVFGSSTFDDANKVGIAIEQKVLKWDDDDAYIILEYRISNKGMSDIADLKLGLFIDWRINNILLNIVNWDESKKLGYVSNDGIKKFGGAALLTNQKGILNAIEVNDIRPFSKVKKQERMTNSNLLAGPGNVAQLLRAEIGSLNKGESSKIAFLLGAAESLTDLKDAVDDAKRRHDTFLANPPVVLIDTVCYDVPTTLSINPPEGKFNFYKDPQGSDPVLLNGNDLMLSGLTKDTTFYIRNVDGSYSTDIKSVKVVPIKIEPDVTLPADNKFYLGDNPYNVFHFKDHTYKTVSWEWNFGNGESSSAKDPIIHFNTVGNYLIELKVTNRYGCTANFKETLMVHERDPKPTFPTYQICPGAQLNIASNENYKLKVYDDPAGTTLLFEGSKIFSPDPVFKDTVFYISNADGDHESLKVEVPIGVFDLVSGFTYEIDTANLLASHLLQFQNKSSGESGLKWTIEELEMENIDNPFFDFTGLDKFKAELEVVDDRNCRLVSVATITPAPGTTPKPITMTICSGSKARVNPADGAKHYFYTDPERRQLIHKGEVLVTGAINRDTTFYMTNVDKLLESEVSAIAIKVIPESANFEISPNPLILKTLSPVKLIDQSLAPVKWKWFIDGKFTEEAQNPVLNFNLIGNYDVKLVILDEQGCESEKTRTLNVVKTTGFDEEAPVNTLIYPTPAKQQLTIEVPELRGSFEVRLIDLTGKKVHALNCNKPISTINLAGIVPGIYSLILTGSSWTESHRLMIME